LRFRDVVTDAIGRPTTFERVLLEEIAWRRFPINDRGLALVVEAWFETFGTMVSSFGPTSEFGRLLKMIGSFRSAGRRSLGGVIP